MKFSKSRIATEKKVLERMVAIYCRGNRHGDVPCEKCRALLDYAYHRLDKCKFGEDKMFCSKCPIHCYKPKMREHIREVMRYSGPRMIFYHPIIAIKHMLSVH